MNPENIGRYQIERLIGRGGMAVIYLARDPNIKRLVAVKVLPRQLTFDPAFRTRFEREATVVAALEHPAIVPIYDFGEDDDRPYFVMRYMPGGSLSQILKRETTTLGQAARIIKRIAPALDEAHQLGIIHRDLKPGNILFDQRNDAYLSDFGIVKMVTGNSTITGDAILGTPAYMSPELARGDPDIDGLSDIYSLGVLAYKMLTGVAPFKADSPMATAMKHLMEPVPNILTENPNLPIDCQVFFDIAMAKDPLERFATAIDLADAFEQITGGDQNGTLPTMTRKPSPRTWRTSSDIATPTLSQPHPQHNLPLQPTSFIGRETLLKEIGDRITSPACRVLTLLGPGGIGKTRLALEAAEEQLDLYPNGVFFIALAPLRSPEFIISTIAETIGFSFYSEEEPKTQILNYLREKEMLLILDNFEHLVDSSDLIWEILDKSPGVKFLVTSRERLNLLEEWILQIHGMAIPGKNEMDQALDYPAIQLFIERARKLLPHFEPDPAVISSIVDICTLVEGIPLGIELAAAWVRMLSPADIAAEIRQNLDFLTTSLRNVSQRHRSLRAVFNYSWKLLDPGEKEAFCNLSVFRGTFSREAAREITRSSFLNLSTLVDKSLLRITSSGYYEMLEVLRQYAAEKFDENPQAKQAIRQKHADYYANFLQNLEGKLKGAGQKEAIDQIGATIENIRAAISWAIEFQGEDILRKAMSALYRYYEIRGWFREGEEVFGSIAHKLRREHGGTKAIDPNMVIFHGSVLAHEAAFFYRLGNHDEAKASLLKSIELLRPMEAHKEMAFALNYLGAVEYLNEDYGSANKYLEESLAIFRKVEDHLGTAISLHHLGLIGLRKQDYTRARNLFQESLEVNRSSGNRFGVGISLNNLGIIAREMGEYEEARQLHRESLEIRKEISDRWGIANSLDGMGQIAIQTKEFHKARRLLQESLKIYQEIGDTRRIDRAIMNLAAVDEALASS